MVPGSPKCPSWRVCIYCTQPVGRLAGVSTISSSVSADRETVNSSGKYGPFIAIALLSDCDRPFYCEALRSPGEVVCKTYRK